MRRRWVVVGLLVSAPAMAGWSFYLGGVQGTRLSGYDGDTHHEQRSRNDLKVLHDIGVGYRGPRACQLGSYYATIGSPTLPSQHEYQNIHECQNRKSELPWSTIRVDRRDDERVIVGLRVCTEDDELARGTIQGLEIQTAEAAGLAAAETRRDKTDRCAKWHRWTRCADGMVAVGLTAKSTSDGYRGIGLLCAPLTGP